MACKALRSPAVSPAPGETDPYGVHPLLAPVREDLVLPDRDGGLEPVDQGPRGVVRLAPVGGRGGDQDGGVADVEVAGAVHGGEGDDLELGGDALGHLAHPLQRGRVGGVVEVVDRLASVVVAHGADEQVHATGRRVLDRGQDLGGVQRGLAQVQQAYDGAGREVTGSSRGELRRRASDRPGAALGSGAVIWSP